MSGHRALLLAMAAAAFVTVSAAAQQIRARDPAWIAPDDASTQVNPLASQTQLAAGGRKVFAQRCSGCHSDDGRGTDRAPDITSAEVLSQSDGALFWKISSGNTRAGMPTFSFLPEPQRWQLVLYLRERRAATH